MRKSLEVKYQRILSDNLVQWFFFLTPEGKKMIFEMDNFDCHFSTWVPCFGGFSNIITLPLLRNNCYTDLIHLKHGKMWDLVIICINNNHQNNSVRSKLFLTFDETSKVWGCDFHGWLQWFYDRYLLKGRWKRKRELNPF